MEADPVITGCCFCFSSSNFVLQGIQYILGSNVQIYIPKPHNLPVEMVMLPK